MTTERPNFFSGKFLTAEDLNAEQNYNIRKRQLHNRELHGWGVASGLEVSTGRSSIRIEPGIAIDCEGNEIVVVDLVSLPVPTVDEQRNPVYIAITYEERKVKEIIVSSKGGVEWDRVLECFEASFLNNNSNVAHRHVGGRWLSCGVRHPLTIARLRREQNGWRVDRRYRPPKLR